MKFINEYDVYELQTKYELPLSVMALFIYSVLILLGTSIISYVITSQIFFSVFIMSVGVILSLMSGLSYYMHNKIVLTDRKLALLNENIVKCAVGKWQICIDEEKITFPRLQSYYECSINEITNIKENSEFIIITLKKLYLDVALKKDSFIDGTSEDCIEFIKQVIVDNKKKSKKVKED